MLFWLNGRLWLCCGYHKWCQVSSESANNKYNKWLIILIYHDYITKRQYYNKTLFSVEYHLICCVRAGIIFCVRVGIIFCVRAGILFCAGFGITFCVRVRTGWSRQVWFHLCGCLALLIFGITISAHFNQKIRDIWVGAQM